MGNDLFLSEVLSFFKNESWIAQVFLVVFITVFFDWIQKRILNKLYAALEKTKTYWDDALIDAIRRPLYVGGVDADEQSVGPKHAGHLAGQRDKSVGCFFPG